MAKNLCAMCDTETPADRGLLCPRHRAEDDAISNLTHEPASIGGADQFTRWLCPKCGKDGFDSWNKAMFDGIAHDPDNLPNPWVIGDTCQCCGWPCAVSYTTPGAIPRAMIGSGFNDFSHEEEAFRRMPVDSDAGVALRPANTRDADWSRGCLAAKGQLQ